GGRMKRSKLAPSSFACARCPRRARQRGRGGIFHFDSGLKGTSTAAPLWPSRTSPLKRSGFIRASGEISELDMCSDRSLFYTSFLCRFTLQCCAQAYGTRSIGEPK